MMKLTRIALVLAVSLHAEDRMRTGLWEITNTHSGASTGTTTKSCFTRAMVELANSSAASMREATEKAASKRAGCTVKDFKLDKSSITMTMVCGATVIVTASTYHGDSFETVNTINEGGVATVGRIKGRLVGPCK